MRVFVPIEDGDVDRHVVPVPYRQGLVCAHGLREAWTLDEEGCWNFSDESSARRPDARRSRPPAPR